MKYSIDPENIIKLFSDESSNKVFLRAFRILKISKAEWKKSLIILILCLVPTIIISSSLDTVMLFHASVECILNGIIALFGIVFTGYAFFQALINKELLVRMLASVKEEEGKQVSKLQETNENFIDLMMMMLLSIIIGLFLKIVVTSIPKDFVLWNNRYCNNGFAGLLIEVYFAFCATIIWEIKSFIFNIFQLFNAHAGARAIEIIDEESDDDID